MEVSSALRNITDGNTGNFTVHLFASNITRNLATVTKKNEILECEVELKDGLFEFIVCGILLNLVSLFGIFGNTISMIILSRPQMKSSINYLLIGLARCDSVLIIIAVMIHGLPAIYSYTGCMFDYKFYVFPKIVKYLYPVSLAAQMVTVYLTLTVTMERYVAVCHPLRARSLCTYGRARAAVICIVIVSFLYNLPRFWEVEYRDEIHWKEKVKVYCVMAASLRESRLYITLYVHWLYFFVYYACPFAALVVFNTAIYKRVRKANRDLQHMSRHQRREIGLAMMLICVVIVFIICNILPMVSNVYENLYTNPPVWMVQIGNLLVTINSSINFIIYVIFGRKFKRIFLKLFCSSNIFGHGRDSPEFQTYDESIVTNTTNIELKNSIRRSHRMSNTCRNNNNQMTNGSLRQSIKGSIRSDGPGPCVYYPARSPVRSPSQVSRISTQNGWSKKEITETVLL
ncbi:FMRFamide receptor-like [Leptopilina boulardi]|uniref:FMRFamide receptor-like n=1 Tax=Leptopilina boulardi TaxID=63433 RepID=UPI0021F5748E|nr:FMRFamide receptor-like [Leptopilina boulardi]